MKHWIAKGKAESCKKGFMNLVLKITGMMHGFRPLILREPNFFYRECLQQEINHADFKTRLESLMAELSPLLRKRAENYDISSRCVDALLTDIQEDLLYQFERWTNNEYLSFIEMKCKCMLSEINPDHRDSLLKLENTISDMEGIDSTRMGRLILSVLGNNCSSEEKELLKGLHRFESCMELSPNRYSNKGSFDGLYLNSVKSIKVFLMGGNSWEDICTILQHEFTHYFTHKSCFNSMIENWPILQNTYWDEDELEYIFLKNIHSVISCLFTGKELKVEKVQEFLMNKLPLEVKPSPEKTFKKAICDESIESTVSYIEDIDELYIVKDTLAAQNMTFSLCNILDESLAYLSERYMNHTYEGSKLAAVHSAIADTEDFEKVYRSLDGITTDMDEECFDIFAKDLCDKFLCAWKPFWTTKEYNDAVISVLNMQC